MIRTDDLVEVCSYQKAISLLNGEIDEILQKYPWEDLAHHPELKVRAIIKCAAYMGCAHERAKKMVEEFTDKLKYLKL